MKYSIKQINSINATTTNFYKEVGPSFSSTRQYEWDGWHLCLPYINSILDNNQDCDFLDLGCGNLRFENFISKNFKDSNINIDAVDKFKIDQKWNFLSNIKINFIKQDIVNSLINNNSATKKYNLIVCFGLFHHIPGYKLRDKLFNYLLDSLYDDSILIISLWQFKKDQKLFTKAKEVTKLAMQNLELSELENNDYFLQWQDRKDVFRFCHNFTDKDIEQIVNKSNNIELLDMFNSDGKQLLNKYLIFKKQNSFFK